MFREQRRRLDKKARTMDDRRVSLLEMKKLSFFKNERKRSLKIVRTNLKKRLFFYRTNKFSKRIRKNDLLRQPFLKQ